MTIKTILVLNDGGANREATLKAALGLARDFAAHLDVLHVRADPETMVPVVGEAMTGAMVEQMMEAMARAVEARAAKAKSAFDKLCAVGDVSTAWHETTGREPEVLAGAGRLADLIVVSRADAEGEGPMAASLDAALFDTGRPVLVTPPVAPGAIGTHVALAWNGSAQAARVVAAALPFLVRAKQVTVLAGADVDRKAPPAALVAYLARHGVAARHEAFEPGHGAVGKLLLEQTGRLGADLLVMGAYGHSRLREMILGGATRDVLDKADVAVLMAH